MSTLEDLKVHVDKEFKVIKIQINKLMEWHVQNSEILDKVLDNLIEPEEKKEKQKQNTLSFS